MNNYQKKLFELQDKDYAKFTAKLTPNVEEELFIGVRVPQVRKLAKELAKDTEHPEFLKALPHKYFDENMLHGLLICEIKDYDECVKELDRFLPFVDNWAVCDITSPKVFKKSHHKLIKDTIRWANSKEIYTSRFGLGILMAHYLDDDFKPEYLEIPAKIKTEEYYLQMMIAWYYATALAKQWDATIPYIEKGVLDKWIHNKTIQKARESYRITPEQKEYLKTLKK